MKCSKCGAKAAGAGFCKKCGSPIVGFSVARAAEQAPGRATGSATPAEGLQYAGFWRRVGASIVDALVIAVPVAVATSFLATYEQTWPAFLKLHPGQTPAELTAAFGPHFFVIIFWFFLLTSWIYFALMESSVWQATVGKRVLLLRVTDLSGQRLSFSRASLRFAGGRLLSAVPVFGGLYFMGDCVFAGVTTLKQALHDIMASSLVIRSGEF